MTCYDIMLVDSEGMNDTHTTPVIKISPLFTLTDIR